MKLALFGATGRMGLTLARLASGAGFSIVGAVADSSDPAIGRDIGELSGIGMEEGLPDEGMPDDGGIPEDDIPAQEPDSLDGGN